MTKKVSGLMSDNQDNVENLLSCEDCGKQDETVHHATCPYAEELNSHYVPIVVCTSCYKERLYDI